jgi:hypothetical protein
MRTCSEAPRHERLAAPHLNTRQPYFGHNAMLAVRLLADELSGASSSVAQMLYRHATATTSRVATSTQVEWL